MRDSLKRLLLAAILRPVQRQFAQRVTWTRGTNGWRRQWRSLFYPLDDRHTATAVRYLELSPVRAGLVREAESFRWGAADSGEYAVSGGAAGSGRFQSQSEKLTLSMALGALDYDLPPHGPGCDNARRLGPQVR